MSKLQLPFKIKARITQTFSNKLYINGKDVYAQWGLKGHNGIDYGLPNGTPVYAPHCGTVKEVIYDKPGYGWYVKIENDIEGSVLAHLQKAVVRVGDYINQGDLIAHSNNTGYSTGAHLHWGYYRKPRDRNNGYGGYIDQTPYLEENPVDNENTNGTNGIKDFLISVGYTYPEAHLEVIKELHQSDLKLKSGKYILKEDCEKEKKSLKKEYEEKINKAKSDCQDKILKEKYKPLKDKVIELEKEANEYEAVRKSTAYKAAVVVTKLLKMLKLKGGNQNGRHSTGELDEPKGTGN